MKSVVTIVALLIMAVGAQAVPHSEIDFNSVTPGWGGAVAGELAALGWGVGGLGTNFKEVRGDDWCPEDGPLPPPYTPELGRNFQLGYYDWAWYDADLSGSATIGAGVQERISYWTKGLNLEDQNTRGNRQKIGQSNTATTAGTIWEDSDTVGGIGLWYDNRSGVDANRWQLLDADHGERALYLPAVGGGDFFRTSGVWYNVVADFNIPAATYDLKVYDEAGVHVAGYAGNTAGTMTELSFYSLVDYNGAVAVTTKVDNFSFESIPEPATMVLLSLGGLALIRRRSA